MGSEMCIRDRPDVAPVHVRTDLPTIWLSLGLLGLVALYPVLWWWRR